MGKQDYRPATFQSFFRRFWLLSFLWLPGIAYADPTLTLDLSEPPPDARITRIFGHGMENDGTKGVPVCGGLDCDGDGFADFAFAQFLGDPLDRIGAGEVTFVFGDGTIGYSLESSTLQPRMLHVAGEQLGEAAGAEVWIDDVNGDGLGDLIIGRQNYSYLAANRPGCGALTILFGSPSWRTQAESLSYLDLGNIPDDIRHVTFVGPAAYDRLGIWMRTGDITGDGIADILVGADEVDAANQLVSQNQGAAFVIRGGAHMLNGPEIVDLGNSNPIAPPHGLERHIARIDPPEGSANYHFGATVQVCDLDGNGRAEAIIAATLNRAGASVRLASAPSGTGQSSGGSRNGAVFIIWDENFPPGPWPNHYRFDATDPPIGDYTRIDGGSEGQAFGEELLGGLDYSGDGFSELMVGDLVADPRGRTNAGRGYVFYNAGNLRGQSFDLDTPPEGVAFTIIDGPLAGAISSDTLLQGDFDGDGIGDVGIGNPHDSPDGRSDAGAIHVLYGQPGGWPAEIDLLPENLPSPSEIRIVWIQGANGSSGSDLGDILCYSAASGDIDGDGRTDLIVNEMAGNALGGTLEDVGNLLVIDAKSLLEPAPPRLESSISGLLDFGVVHIESNAPSKSLVLRNAASETVTIDSLELVGPQAGDFSILTDSGELSLAMGEERTLELSFDPSRSGRFGAALRVQINTQQSPTLFGMAGKGVSDSLVSPKANISIIEDNAIFEVQSQFGAEYYLNRLTGLSDPSGERLGSLSGTGQAIYFTEPVNLDAVDDVFYQVEARRE